MVVLGTNASLGGEVRANQTVVIRSLSYNTTTVTLENSVTNAGTLRLEPGCDTAVCGSVRILLSSGTLTNTGTLETSTTGGTVRISTNLVNESILNADRDLVLDATNGVYANAGTVTLGPSRTLTIAAGVFTNQADGSINGAAGTVSISQDSTLGGTGTITPQVTNAGTLKPGSPTGVLHIIGSYRQTATGKLVIELGGHPASGQFGQLNVDGTATLGGILHIMFINSFEPSAGDRFRVMNLVSHIGTFATINTPSGTSVTLSATIGTSDVTLESTIRYYLPLIKH